MKRDELDRLTELHEHLKTIEATIAELQDIEQHDPGDTLELSVHFDEGWEQDGQCGETMHVRPEDLEAFLKLMAMKLTEQLEAAGISDGHKSA